MQKSLLTQLMDFYGHGGHSIFAPSGSAMWLFCAGSLIANMMADDECSFEAAEGTVAHALAEEWLRTGFKPTSLIGEEVWHREPNGEVFEIMVDEIMMDHIQEYVDWCRFEEGDHFVETRVFFTDLMPPANADELDEDEFAVVVNFVEQGGTADHVVCRPGVMVITDFKYGKGIQVFAMNNTQAMLYALGFFYKWDWKYHFERIIIRIAQPRFDHMDVWEITREDLLAFAEFVRVRAAEAWSLNAPRYASVKSCRWCRVKGSCTALAKLNEALLVANFDDIDEQSADDMENLKDRLDNKYKFQLAKHATLTTEQMARILPYRKLIEAWWEAMDAEVEKRAKDGQEVPGYKLVEARTFRKFSNEAKAVEHLRFLGLDDKDIYKVDVVSPAQAEELLRKKAGYDRALIPNIIGSQVYKPPGRPTLAVESDNRPALNQQYDVWDD